MSEWLDLMLEEVARKKREQKEAEEEHARRAAELAAGLPRPRTWNPRSDSGGYRRRVDLIRARMRQARWLLKEI